MLTDQDCVAVSWSVEHNQPSNDHARAERQCVVRVEARVARPERGPTRLVERVRVRIRAVTLCSDARRRKQDAIVSIDPAEIARVLPRTEIVVVLYT